MPKTLQTLFRRGGAVPLVAALITLMLVAWMGASSMMGGMGLWPKAKLRLRHDPQPPTAQELAVTLTRLGLDATSLAAAGLPASDTTALVGRMSSDLSSRIQAIRDADTDCGIKRAEVDRLESLIRGGLGTQQDLSSLATARSNLASALASRTSTLNAALAAALDGVDGSKAATLSTMHTNNAQWDLPTQYLAGAHAEPDWVNLRDALANDRISTAQHTDPDPAAHQLILDALADPNVSAANTNLTNSLADVTAAWNTAVFGH